MKKQPVYLLAGLSAVVALTACGGSAATSSQTGNEADETISIEVARTPNGSAAAVALGIDNGTFNDSGIEPEVVPVANPAAAVASLQGGQVDFAALPATVAINAIDEGMDLVIIAALDGFPEDETIAPNFDTMGVYVGSDSGLESPGALEGKTVSVPARSGQIEIAVSGAISEDGGDPEKVDWVSLDLGTAVSSLEAGTIDGAGLSSPFTDQAVANGAISVSSPQYEFFDGGAAGYWVAGPSTAADPDLRQQVQAAIYEANSYANNNLEETYQKISELTELDIDVIRDSESTFYYPESLELEEIERAADKMRDLGYLEDSLDLTDRFLAINEE